MQRGLDSLDAFSFSFFIILRSLLSGAIILNSTMKRCKSRQTERGMGEADIQES